MRSLRNRLILATIAAMLLVLVFAASLLYGLIRQALLTEFDAALLAKARALAAVAEMDEGRFELDLEVAQMPEFESSDSCEYFQMWAGNGSTLARSSSLSGDSLDASEANDAPGYRFLRLIDGRPGRQVTVRSAIRTELEEDRESHEPAEDRLPAIVTIAVARDTLDLDQTLRRLRVLLASVSLGATLLSVVVLAAVVHFALKPVERLAERISGIDASNVSSAGTLCCSIEELDPVVDRLNELLKRLHEAFAREKAFTSDVAHELRTPLAGLSAALEVCSSRPRDEAAYQEVIAKCWETTRGMQSMVENLLELARADAGQLTLRKEPLDFIRFAADCWQPFEEHATRRELHLTWQDRAETIRVVTDRDRLGLVLRNLFDNAVRHADRGGTVSIEIADAPDEIVFEVRNTGCDLTPEDGPRVFERFWKHDSARTEGAEHCGLGLPLCRRIVEVLGGSIAADVGNGSFVVRLLLPREPDDE